MVFDVYSISEHSVPYSLIVRPHSNANGRVKYHVGAAPRRHGDAGGDESNDEVSLLIDFAMFCRVGLDYGILDC